jgi:chromosome segregation ATPase|uniref:MbeD/MobD family mobilization/exclusion protein n=1 Tax=Acinetobacter pittii TaxID=48296 RepID=UPI00355C7543
MTELERHLLEALEQAQAQQQQKEADLQKMFERTRQDNQSVKEAFKSLLESISATDQTRNEHLNKLVRLVNNLSDQLQDFKTQNATLTKQLQVLEMQVLKLKK